MNINRLTVATVLIACTSPNVSAANQGLSGSLGAVIVYNQSQNNLSTAAAETLTSLNGEAEHVDSSTLLPLGQVRYQFHQHQIFVGQSEDTFVKGLLGLEIGYKNQWHEGSSFTLAYAPTLVAGEAWQNAYLIDNKREKTSIKGDVVRVNYEYQYAGLKLAYYDRAIKNEQAPSDLLNRNGDGYFAQFALTLPLSGNLFIEPSLFYQHENTQGKANTFDKFGAGLAATLTLYPYTLVIDARISGSDYEVKHPLFKKVREDELFHLQVSAEEKDFLGINQVSLIAQVNYQQSNSNLTFYDSEEFGMLIGALYRF
ncbi:DUF2860 family protein [Vibrio salilacus]|uniref:DUF2860 family protein n=1 Tax=Vibrio salilacus TaxID=1323749 RepID=UPI000C2A657C|nr:DUF2860 family protein [Vibrio salilacus]